jgi:hypothetical protein
MSRVWTKIVYVWDENEHQVEIDLSRSAWFDDYRGPVASCKESSAEKANRVALQGAQTNAALQYYNVQLPWERQMATQQMDLYNTTTQKQLGMEDKYMSQQQDQYKQYMQLMNQQFGKQNALSDTVTAAMTPYLSKEGVGYTPEQMTALNNQAMSQTAGGYGDASAALKQMLLAHGEGGANPYGGTAFDNMALLQSRLADTTAGIRNTNQLGSIQQALQNRFQAAGVVGNMAGQSAGIGTSAMGAGDSALAGYGAGANNYAVRPLQPMPGAPQMTVNPNTQTPGFWEKMGNGLIGGLSQGVSSFIGGAATGGLGAFTSWLGKGSGGGGTLPGPSGNFSGLGGYNPWSGLYQ